MKRFSRENSEAGLALFPYLVIIAIMVTSPIWVPAVQDINDVIHGRWDPKEKEAPAPTAADMPFIGPGLPTDKVKADCVKKAADRVGLYYTAKGWRTGDIDEPSLIGDPAKVRADIAFFGRRMQAYVGAREKEWASCLKDTPEPPEPPSSSEPAPEIAGTYVLQFQEGGDSYCRNFTLPSSIKVMYTGASDISITMTTDSYTDQLNGSVDRGYGFSANGSRQVGGGLSLRMLGRFDREGSVTVIRNGSMVFDSEEQCSFSFTGTRSGA